MKEVIFPAVIVAAIAFGPLLFPGHARAEEDRRVIEKNQKLAQCEKEGNVPVLGFGLTVVCIKKESVAWTWSGGNW